MKQRPIFIFSIAVLCLLTAYVLRNLIYEIIIVPFAYLWWVLGLYYRFLPQVAIWVLLIAVILFTAIRGLLMEIPVGKRMLVKKKKSEGPVEALSLLVQKSKQGNYYKWLIANRLGKSARELLDQREARGIKQKFTRLKGRGWNPPKDVEAYLESGVNGSFADYPQRTWAGSPSTPLDLNPQKVIEYLESEMENNRNGHR